MNLLAAAGADKGAEKIGLGKFLGDNKPSVIVSKIAYFFILIPIIGLSEQSGHQGDLQPLKATLERLWQPYRLSS